MRLRHKRARRAKRRARSIAFFQTRALPKRDWLRVVQTRARRMVCREARPARARERRRGATLATFAFGEIRQSTQRDNALAARANRTKEKTQRCARADHHREVRARTKGDRRSWSRKR